MKNAIFFTIMTVATLLLASCKPGNYDIPAYHTHTDAQAVLDLNPRAIPDSDNPNRITFTMDERPGLVGVWFISGKRYAQPTVSRYYDFAGEYVVKAFAYDHDGVYPMVDVVFSVAENDPGVCDNSNYNMLTGGCEMPEGKTWVLADETGYYGLGDIKSFEPDWWAAERGSHNGVYDDEITFMLNSDKTYRHITHGTSGVDSEEIEVADYEASWELYEDGTGKLHIALTGEGFFPPQPSETEGIQDYTVCELTEEVLRLKVYASGSNQAWFYKFVPKE